MRLHAEHKTIHWMGDTQETVSAFPADVKRLTGYALRFAQAGETHPDAKRLRHDLRDVFEVSEIDASGTFRTCYTVAIGDRVYVLHAFQKKSKAGISTPKSETDLIKKRLKEAREDYERHAKGKANKDKARQR